jgi:hypothetical protein
MAGEPEPAIPADPELVKRITMLAERVAKKPDIESIMREKQGSDPDWAFLNDGEGADFYESEKLRHQQMLAAQMREQFAAAPPDLARPDLVMRPPPGSTGYPVPPPGPRPPPGPLPAYGVSAGYGGPSPGNGGSAPSYGGGGGGGRSGYRRADDGMGRVDEARVEQLLVEREGYAIHGRDDRVAEVDEQLALRGYKAAGEARAKASAKGAPRGRAKAPTDTA